MNYRNGSVVYLDVSSLNRATSVVYSGSPIPDGDGPRPFLLLCSSHSHLVLAEITSQPGSLRFELKSSQFERSRCTLGRSGVRSFLNGTVVRISAADAQAANRTVGQERKYPTRLKSDVLKVIRARFKLVGALTNELMNAA